MKSDACAAAAAFSISPSVASSRPNRMFSFTLVPKITASCGTSAMRKRNAAGSTSVTVTPSKLTDSAFAGARRADQSELLARRDAKRHMIKNRCIGPAGIFETHILEFDGATSRRRQGEWPRRSLDLRLHIEDFEQPLRRSGCLRDFAPDLAQLAEAAGGKHGVENELPEATWRDVTGKHVLRADPQYDNDAGKNQKDDDGREHAARLCGVTGRRKSALDRSGEPRLREFFVGEGLQRTNGADEFVGIARRFGKRILRSSPASAHHASKTDERKDDDRYRPEHEQGQAWAGDHHHGGTTQEEQQITQCDRNRGADRRFDLRRVRGQPRNDFTGTGRIEK